MLMGCLPYPATTSQLCFCKLSALPCVEYILDLCLFCPASLLFFLCVKCDCSLVTFACKSAHNYACWLDACIDRLGTSDSSCTTAHPL